jgi:hypothetical protein
MNTEYLYVDVFPFLDLAHHFTALSTGPDSSPHFVKTFFLKGLVAFMPLFLTDIIFLALSLYSYIQSSITICQGPS